MTDADYADDVALLTNTPAKAETLLLSLEQAAGDMSVHSCNCEFDNVFNWTS